MCCNVYGEQHLYAIPYILLRFQLVLGERVADLTCFPLEAPLSAFTCMSIPMRTHPFARCLQSRSHVLRRAGKALAARTF